MTFFVAKGEGNEAAATRRGKREAALGPSPILFPPCGFNINAGGEDFGGREGPDFGATKANFRPETVGDAVLWRLDGGRKIVGKKGLLGQSTPSPFGR